MISQSLQEDPDQVVDQNGDEVVYARMKGTIAFIIYEAGMNRKLKYAYVDNSDSEQFAWHSEVRKNIEDSEAAFAALITGRIWTFEYVVSTYQKEKMVME